MTDTVLGRDEFEQPLRRFGDRLPDAQGYDAQGYQELTTLVLALAPGGPGCAARRCGAGYGRPASANPGG